MSRTLFPRTGASYSGGTHFTKAKANTGPKSYGGTIFYAGTIGINTFNQESLSSPAITVSLGYGNGGLGIRSGFSETPPSYGSTAGGVNRGVSGDFAKLTANHYIAFGYNSASFAFIAGNSNTTWMIGNQGQHPWRNAFAAYIRTWNRITLTPNGGAPNGWSYVTGYLVNQTVFSADHLNTETNPGSYAIPGDIFFLSTGKGLTTKVIAAKTD